MRSIVLFCIFLLSACNAGSGTGLDESGRPIGEAGVPTDLPTLANIQTRVFTPICTQCHVGASAPQGLRLDATNSFDDLVGVPSREVGSLLRVSPGDPDNSYLVQKIEGTASVGGRMPLGGPSLPAEDIALVRQWISDGASQTATATHGVSAGLASVRSVQEEISISGDVRVVRIAFSKPLDASTIHNSSVAISRSDDSVFGNRDDTRQTRFAVSSSAANPNAISIRIQISDDDKGWYRFQISAPGSALILDSSGQPVAAYELEIH